MGEDAESQIPEVHDTGMVYDKITGQDASKPVTKQRVKIVQVGASPSNIEARDPKTGGPVDLGDVQKVDILKTLGRTVPDKLAQRVDKYYKIRAKKFTKKYMPKQK